MQFRAPTTLKLISYRYSNQILKNFLDLRVISEKSAPEVGSPISDFSGKINGWAQRREAIRTIRGVGFGWFLGKKTRFWAQVSRNSFPELHIRSAESTNVLYDHSKDEPHTTSGTLSSVHRKVAAPEPNPAPAAAMYHSVYSRVVCTQCVPVYPGGQNRTKSENQRISRTRASWTNWWLFWNVQLRLWVDCKWFRIDRECSRGLKLAKTCFSNKTLAISKRNPLQILTGLGCAPWGLRPRWQKSLKNVRKILKNRYFQICS